MNMYETCSDELDIELGRGQYEQNKNRSMYDSSGQGKELDF